MHFVKYKVTKGKEGMWFLTKCKNIILMSTIFSVSTFKETISYELINKQLACHTLQAIWKKRAWVLSHVSGVRGEEEHMKWFGKWR